MSELRAARARLGWSQDELGRKAGMTRREVYQIETGWMPPLEVRQRLADALGRPVDEVFPPAGQTSPDGHLGAVEG